VRGWEEGREERVFIPPQRTEKWSRKRTAMKIKRLSPNHRVNDVLCLGAGPSASLHGKFEYGPLGMVSLVKELVRFHLSLSSRTPLVTISTSLAISTATEFSSSIAPKCFQLHFTVSMVSNRKPKRTKSSHYTEKERRMTTYRASIGLHIMGCM
jgi:hypothetical protein